MARKPIEIINKAYDCLLKYGVATIVCKARLNDYNFDYSAKANGEDEWYKKWSKLGKTNKKWYRLYSSFIGKDMNIVPDDIMSNVIEPILNPVRYRSLYEDKNLLDNFFMTQFKESITPPTLLRCINGAIYTETFEFIDENRATLLLSDYKAKKLISKASIDENSSRGIYFWEKDGAEYRLINQDIVLSIENLKNLYPSGNFILQEVAVQSEWMNHLCPTSVNTLRIHMYRSVIDNKPHLVNAVVRIGKDGSLVDNAHAGGVWCGIRKDGTLLDFVIDQYANTQTQFNGIDFSKEKLQVPNWGKIEAFCEKVLLSLTHMRNLALDVMIDKDGNPKIIEYNTDKFSTFFYQLTTSSVFDEYTDEVFEYCRKNIENATRIFVTF